MNRGSKIIFVKHTLILMELQIVAMGKGIPGSRLGSLG